MIKRILVAYALSALLLVASCGKSAGPGGQAADGTPVPFQNILSQCSFTVNDPATSVYMDSTTWGQLWSQYCGAYEVPAVDFDSEMVLAVFYGGGSYSGCQSWVEVIVSITATDDQIVVNIGPLDEDQLGACDGMAFPIQLVRIDRSDLPVVFTGNLPE
ncbi:MAG: hypothetical protein GY835_01995 [bacterium]|nr:hypothetical protein [bacterium]